MGWVPYKLIQFIQFFILTKRLILPIQFMLPLTAHKKIARTYCSFLDCDKGLR